MIFEVICQSSCLHFPALVSSTTLLAPNIHSHVFLLFSLDIYLHHFLDVLGQNLYFQFSFLAIAKHTDCALIPPFLITQVIFVFFYYFIFHEFVYCLAILCWLHVFHIFPSILLYHGKHKLSLNFIFLKVLTKVF